MAPAEGTRLTRKHVVSGSFWTVADERVPRSGVQYYTVIRAPTLSQKYSNWNDAAIFTCELIPCLFFLAGPLY